MATDSLPILELLQGFTLHLRAKNRADKTILSYRQAVEQLAEHAGNLPIAEVARKDIEGYLVWVLGRNAPATARNRYASLVQFFRWAVDDGEIETSPMEKVEPPALVDQPVPVLSPDQIRALLAACKVRQEGRDNKFEQVRDEAIIRLFADTGIRLGEMTGLSRTDIDLDLYVAVVTGKGRRLRTVPFGDRTASALERYGRHRTRHKHSSLDAWWLGYRGALTDSGITQLLRRRAAIAGIEGIHPHQFRHSFAHQWLASGGNEGDLQRIAGWSSPQMLQRYGRSAADQRARANYRKVNLWGDL